MADPSLRELINNARALCAAGDLAGALQVFRDAEEQRLPHPELLVWKAICSQLAPDTADIQLSDIEQMLLEALRVDAECVNALLELGWFYLSVYDDATSAKTFFSKALELERTKMSDAIIGMARCLKETDSLDDAAAFLSASCSNAIDSERIDQELNDLRLEG